jgi:hypothetical protein
MVARKQDLRERIAKGVSRNLVGRKRANLARPCVRGLDLQGDGLARLLCGFASMWGFSVHLVLDCSNVQGLLDWFEGDVGFT